MCWNDLPCMVMFLYLVGSYGAARCFWQLVISVAEWHYLTLSDIMTLSGCCTGILLKCDKLSRRAEWKGRPPHHPTILYYQRNKGILWYFRNSSRLTLKVLNFWKLTSYCSLKPLWSGMGEVVPARISPTLHPPSPPTVHQLSQLTSTLRVNRRLVVTRS